MLPNAVILARGICGFPPLEGNMRSFRLASVYALIFAQGMFGQAFKTLAVFDGTNGSTPEGAFTQGANGSLYSTTYAGGGHSAGTVFKMTPAGALTTLYSFTGAGSGVGDGSGPYSAPVLATSGNFYGTTPYAGASGFYGTVYQISPSGTLTTLYSFCATGGSCTDGVKPFAGLVQGVNGQRHDFRRRSGQRRLPFRLRHNLQHHSRGPTDDASQLPQDGWHVSEWIGVR